MIAAGDTSTIGATKSFVGAAATAYALYAGNLGAALIVAYYRSVARTVAAAFLCVFVVWEDVIAASLCSEVVFGAATASYCLGVDTSTTCARKRLGGTAVASFITFFVGAAYRGCPFWPAGGSATLFLF